MKKRKLGTVNTTPRDEEREHAYAIMTKDQPQVNSDLSATFNDFKKPAMIKVGFGCLLEFHKLTRSCKFSF